MSNSNSDSESDSRDTIGHAPHLFIYHVDRPPTNPADYDQYHSFVVVARSSSYARKTTPTGHYGKRGFKRCAGYGWTNMWIPYEEKDSLVVTRIGRASKKEKRPRIVEASFNAG